ncbi:hypothetical protein [Pseudarthrobacter sp. YAF2]|uniref:hypothetical protein n=1 Tax=Pseudarthrobacter sp. YAF2 TaxID=3233078 RepID=UPI003F99307A
MSRPPVNPEGAPTSPDHPGNGPGRPAGKHPAAAPAAARVVALIAGAEAIALLVAAAWYGYELFTGSPVLSFWGAVFTLGLLLAFSAWLFAVSVFLYRGYRWTRAAALVAQLFVLAIGVPTLTSGLVLAGLAMVVPAGIAIVLLFSNKVISHASRTGSPPPAL